MINVGLEEEITQEELEKACHIAHEKNIDENAEIWGVDKNEFQSGWWAAVKYIVDEMDRRFVP